MPRLNSIYFSWNSHIDINPELDGTAVEEIAKFLIDQGSLGKLYLIRPVGYRQRGRPCVDRYGSPALVQKEVTCGGALYDMSVYHIANLLYLLGNPHVLRVSGKIYHETGMDPVRAQASGFNVEELGLGFVKLKEGLTLDLIEV